MVKKRNKLTMFIVIALVAVAGWYFFFPKACVTDNDCVGGQVCGLDGMCKPFSNTWDNYDGIKPDGRCALNEGVDAVLDPDCPLFCHIGTPLERAGIAGFCCYDDAATQQVDCETGQPVFETETNSFGETINILPSGSIPSQAVLEFGPSGGALSTTFVKNVANTITWNAPATFPAGLASVDIWLDSVTIIRPGIVRADVDDFVTKLMASKTHTGLFTWGKNGGTSQEAQVVQTNADTLTMSTTSSGQPTRVAAIANDNGFWVTDVIDLNAVTIGDYVVEYKYCFQDPGQIIDPAQCETQSYDMKLTDASLSFTVNVQLQ